MLILASGLCRFIALWVVIDISIFDLFLQFNRNYIILEYGMARKETDLELYSNTSDSGEIVLKYGIHFVPTEIY
jgi:hypothetical protein